MALDELGQRHKKELEALFVDIDKISDGAFGEKLNALMKKQEAERQSHTEAVLRDAQAKLDAQLKGFYK